MRKFLLSILLLFPALFSGARKLEPWQDPSVFQENRLPMRTSFTTDQQQTLSLNGRWKFHWSATPQQRLKGFETVTYNDASWKEMPVPGLWELNGFGDPVYVNVGYAWRGRYRNNPPLVPEEGNHVGQYRRVFDIPASWIGKQIGLCIGSATSNVRVWINGKPVGYSEDSKLETRFDIGKYVHAGLNVIALEVFRWCDGTYLEDQDFWRLSGIARGIYVYTRERARIEDVHIVADDKGQLSVEAELSSGIPLVALELSNAQGKVVASFSAPVRKGRVSARASIGEVQCWSAEIPYLYRLKVSALDGRGNVQESAGFDVGFRSVSIEGGQLLVNRKPVLLKGVNRHELDPYKGYVLSQEDMIRDIRLMKSLNINAVRTCHYPDDPLWLTLCDRYGLYVVDEGNIESHGMGYRDGVTLAQDPQFRAAHLERDKRMVQRDYNHPCVIVWSLGNEAGPGGNFVDCRDWIKSFDATRPVQYESALGTRFDCSDIFSPMYWSPEDCEKYLSGKPERPLIQCEYAHAMGNSVGNFKEYWDLVRRYPQYQGGFIWDFQDQALWNGRFFAFGGDYNAADPSDGSFNCNGLVAADRSLHPHAYEVRYQYRSILSSGSPDSLCVHNEFFFRDLSDVRLHWILEADGEPMLTGVVENLAVAPGESALLDLGIPPEDWQSLDGMITLTLRYRLKRPWPLQPAGSEIAYDQLLLRDTRPVLLQCEGGRIGFYDSASSLVLSGVKPLEGTSGERESLWSVTFNKKTGALSSYMLERKEMLREPLLPCFERAATENDLGASLPSVQGFWRAPSLEVQRFAVSPQEDTYLVEVQFVPIGGAAALSVFYRVYADGSLAVVETMSDAGGLSEVPDLFRFGMRLALRREFDRLDYLGLGPWENYPDRASAALLGRYRQSVASQYHQGYVRTQESGTHTGLRFFRVLDAGGNGLQFASARDFSASALSYSLEELSRNVHPQELPASSATYVHVDLQQMGVGGITSWGTLPLEQYRLHPGYREFRFVLSPVVNY